MSYFGFHLRFNLPLLLLLAVAAGSSFWTAPSLTAAGLVLGAVMLFTIPWDNYAAAKGIWGFPAGRYALKIGWLPVEEYLFFLLQTFEVMFLTRFLCNQFPLAGLMSPPDPIALARTLALPALAWGGLGLFAGRKIPRRFHYAWHLLYWFLPVIGFQWALAPHLLAPRWPVLSASTFGIGGFLAVADAIAIRSGVWWIDPAQSTGHRLAHILPWEEALFFLLTSLLVAQSYLLLLPAGGR